MAIVWSLRGLVIETTISMLPTHTLLRRQSGIQSSTIRYVKMHHFSVTRRVEFSETDMAGIVHFANYYRWMEEAEHDFFRSIGLSIMRRLPDGSYLGWPRVSAQCNFERPLFYADTIELRVTVERIGFKSLTFVIEMFKNDQRVAHGRMKTACCLCKPEGALESVEIPADYLAVIPIPEPTPPKRS